MEPSTWNGNPHRTALLHRLLRREIGHPGSGFALAVHNHKTPSRFLGVLGKLLVQCVGQLSARLGHGPQGGQVHFRKPHPVQHLIGVGYAAEGGSLRLSEEGPELPLGQRFFCNQQSPAG